MEYETSNISMNDSLAGTSITKHDGNKEERTESPKRCRIASEHSPASRKKPLRNDIQNSLPFHQEDSQRKHRDDIEKKRRGKKNLRDIPQQSDTQIPNAATGTASISAVDASKTCSSKIEGCNLSRERKRPLDCTIQNCTHKAAKKVTHMEVVSTNCKNISAEKSDIKAAPSSSSSKDESSRKHTQSFLYKSTNRSSCSEDKTVPNDASTSVSAKKMSIESIYAKCLSSENKSLGTTVPIPLKKHHSENSIDPSKYHNVFGRENKEIKESKAEEGGDLFPVKSKLIDKLQESSYKSRDDNIFPQSDVGSSNAIILDIKTHSKVNVNNFADENQDINTSLHQSSTKKDVSQGKQNLEFKNTQTDSQSTETNLKVTIKRKISPESLDRNISSKKMRKENEVNTSPEKVVAASNTEILPDNEMPFDDKLVHTKQKSFDSIIKCMIRERESYELLTKRREQRRKKISDKIKKKREKLRKYFRDDFDPGTSESEEERKILQRSSDGTISEEEIACIFKKNEKLTLTSANKLQKDMESVVSAKINSGDLCGSTVSIEKYSIYDATTDEEIEGNASIYKRGMSVDSSQKKVESINSDNNSCDFDTCTKNYSMSQNDVAKDEETENGLLICESDTSDDNSRESTETVTTMNEIEVENSNDSSACTEKYYSMRHATTEKDLNDGVSTCKSDMSINNLPEVTDISADVKSDNSNELFKYIKKYINNAAIQEEVNEKALTCTNDALLKNIENAIPAKLKSNNACNFTAGEKCDTTVEKIIDKGEASIHTHDILSNNLRENMENAIPAKLKSNNACNFTAGEKCDTTVEKIIDKGEASIHTHDILSNNLQENIENAIPIEEKSNNSCDSTASTEKYTVLDTTTNEKTKDGVPIRGTSIINSQENIESAISTEEKSDNSCDFTENIEKYSMSHTTRDEKIENDGASMYRSGMPADNSENIESAVLTKEQHMENSSSIIDTENNSKSDAHAESNKDIPSTITTNLDENMGIENIHLNQNVEKEADTSYTKTNQVNMQAALENHQENEEMHSDESSDLAQSRNVQKHTTSNLKLPFMSARESISCNVDEKDGCDTMQNSENLLLRSNITKGEKKIDQLSMIATKAGENSPKKINNDSLSIHSSNSSTSNKSNSNDNHSLDGHSADDDNGSDIEIEIKIKPKLKRRVSQKFSLKAPWSALNTCIKNLHTFKDNPSVLSELFQVNKTKSKHCTTSKEDNTSLDGNRSVTFKTKEITREFSPISEDVNDSPQNFQDSPILNEDSHVVDHNKKERDEHEQSVKQKAQITTENNLGSSEVACDTSDLAEQKTNEEQNSQDNATLEGAMKHNQGEEIECLSSVKKTQIAAENSSGSVSAADNLPDVEKQLPQTSLDAHRKVRVRSIAELSCQCSMKSMNLNLSMPRTACSAFCQSATFQSTPQSAPLQPPQLISPQLAPPQLVPSQLAPPKLIPPQSISNRPPPYDIAADNLYASCNTNSSFEIDTLNDKNDLINLIQSTIKRVYIYFANCRNLTRQCRLLGRYPSSEYIQRMHTNLKIINRDLMNLKEWLQVSDIENVITYINQNMLSSQPLTTMEYRNYIQIVQSYLHYSAQISQQNNVKSNVLQYSNVGGLVPSASMSDVNAQPSFMQSSTAPTIPNIQQQRLIASSANSTQVPQSRQPIERNIRQQYPSYVPPPTVHSRIPNVNHQQFLRNVNPIQGQYIPSADMPNVGIQQGFVNMSNVSSSNANMRSRGPVNQAGNTNVPPTSNMSQLNFTLQTNIISNTATVSTAKSQQQKQMYSQTQLNLGTIICPPSVTKQNIPLGTRQTVHNVVLPGSFTVNSENMSRSSLVPQASSETTQSLPHVQIAAQQNEIYFLVSQLAHSNIRTHPVQSTLLDQGVRQIPQQNLPVNQGNTNVPPTTSTTHVTSTNTIGRPVHLSINDTSRQNVQQNVPIKGAEIGGSQNKNYMQKKASSTNPQQNVRQGIPSVSQNIFGTVPVTSTSQRLCVLQNTISRVSMRKNGLHILPPPILARLENPKRINDFNLTVLTEIQKIVLRNQIQSYFTMFDELKDSLNKQQFQRMSHERLVLLYFYLNLDNYVNNIIAKSQTTKPVEKNSQDNTSQNSITALQENIVQTSVDTLTKTQSSRDNESNSACNKNLEKQSSEQNINPNISKNSTTVRSNLETSSKESLFMPESAITKEPLPKDTRLKEQNNTVKKQFQKSSLIDTGKEPESREISLPELSKTPEANLMTDEMAAKNSKTEAQDNAKISESLKAVSSHDKQYPELSSFWYALAKETEDQSEITEKNNNNTVKKQFQKKSLIDTDKGSKSTETLLPEHSKTPGENSIAEVFKNNSETETQDNAKINKSLESESSLDKLFTKLDSLTQSPLNLLQDAETEDQLEIAKNNANENSSNVKITLNSSGKNNATSRASCNAEDKDKKVHDANNEISSKNLQDVRENAEVLNSTKTQSDPLNISRSSESSSLNSARASPKKNRKVSVLSQLGTAHEKEHFETISELCLSAQQEDPTYYERSGYSTDEMSDCSGKLYIDESAEEENDKISSSEEDNLCTSQDSTRLVDTIRSKSTQVTSLSLPENTPETDLFNECQDFIANDVEKLNEEPSLEAEKMQLEDTSLKLDKWNMISVIQSIGNIKNQDVKEENSELLLQAEAIEFQEALEAPEDISNNEEILMNSSYLMKNFPEYVEEEKMVIDVHNNSKAIDEHVSDWRYEKSPTSSCSSVQKDGPVDVNVKEIFAENNFLKADTVESISIKNGSEFAETVPSIFNIRSISPSLFDTIEDMNSFFDNDSKSLNENDGKSLNINDNLEITHEIDDRPCLRCKRKSTVYCEACLEAHYCSKRCSSLHWNTEHYKQCKGHNSIIYIDD